MTGAPVSEPQSPAPRAPHVAIVGGGLTGLTAAWHLRQRLGENASITILEAYGRLGGKLKTVPFHTGPVDMGAEAYLALHTDFTEFVQELGLGEHLASPSGLPSGVYADGVVHDIPRATFMGIPAHGADVAHIVGADAATAIDKETDGAPIPWTPGDDIAVGDLVAQRYGSRVVSLLVSPLLGGVYSCSASDLGLRATLPQLAEHFDAMAREQRPVYLSTAVAELLAQRTTRRHLPDADVPTPTPIFHSFSGGYRLLVNRLAHQAQADIVLNSAVESIGKTSRGWYLDACGDVDAIILAVPAPTASVLLEPWAPRASTLLGEVELATSAVVGMRFASDFGLPERSGILLGPDSPTAAKAFTFSSKKWPHLGDRPGAIVRASFGTLREPWYAELSDRQLLHYAVEDLQRVTGVDKRPEEFFVQRWWGGLPRYGVGHDVAMRAVVEDVDAIAGLAIGGAAIDGVGVPACAASGRRAASKVCNDLGL